MPQDNLRSVVYRSFVTCDDPKGVVECGTIRKSKSGCGKLEHKIERQKTKDLNTSLAHKSEKEKMIPKGITEEFRNNPSSLQLLEVSRGAQKLNQMIDSWSKGMIYDGQSKDIAKDLLKGALDLQDSLVMLNKLQEASYLMAKLKKKQKEKSERERIDEVGIERSSSDRLGDHNYHMGFQKPRFSVDESSMDCHEELRKVIRESFARQNLLPNATEENNRFLRRKLDSAVEIPSTSSSQSSMVHTNNFSSTDSYLSSATPPKKAKGTNLIAKLMGLEEFPARALQSTPCKHSESEKNSNHQRHIFDIDMPKLRKPSSLVQKEDHERKTLKEILETMQFKGLLKSTSVKDIEYQPHHPKDYHSKQRLIDEFPPIVLIKPGRVPHVDSEEPQAPIFREEGALNTNMMLRKPKGREELSSKKIDCKDWAIKSNKISRKMEAEETPMKKLSQEEGAKDCKEIVGKPEEKEIKTKQKASTKMKASSTITHRPRKMEAIDKKAIKTLKATVTRKQPVQKDIAKATNVSRPHDQVKVTLAKAKKPESGTNVAKKQIPRKQSSTPNSISNCTTQTIAHSSSDRNRSLIKKEKLVTEPTATKFTTKNVGRKEDEKVINLACEHGSVLLGNNTTPADQISSNEETDYSEFPIGEHCNNSESSLCDNVPPNSENEKDLESVEEVSNNLIGRDNKDFQTETSLKVLLLTAPAFLSHAEELFNFNVNGATTLQTFGDGIDDFTMSNQRLMMDCASELIEHRSIPDSGVLHPLLQRRMGKFSICISLDQLLEEVCDGIETLKSYSKFARDHHPTDSHYAMLERDIRCKGLASGIWDFGWRNEFSVDDTEQVVNDIEKLIVSGLIGEILS